MVCEGCLGRYHRTCWATIEQCDACGEGRALVVGPIAPAVVPLRVPEIPSSRIARGYPRRRLVAVGVLAGFVWLALPSTPRPVPAVAPTKGLAVPRALRSRSTRSASSRAPTSATTIGVGAGRWRSIRGRSSSIPITSTPTRSGRVRRVRATTSPGHSRTTRTCSTGTLRVQRPGPAAGGRSSDMGRPDAAIADLTRAIEAVPTFSYAWSMRAWAHQLSGDLKNALVEADYAVQIDPGNGVSFCCRGTSCGIAGEAQGPSTTAPGRSPRTHATPTLSTIGATLACRPVTSRVRRRTLVSPSSSTRSTHTRGRTGGTYGSCRGTGSARSRTSGVPRRRLGAREVRCRTRGPPQTRR